MNPLPSAGFVDRYVAGRFVPSGRMGVAQAIAFTSAAVSWALLALRVRRG